MTVRQLKSKAWYRTLKVVYIILFVILAGVSTRLAYESNIKEQTVVDTRKTMISCNWSSGKARAASKLRIHFPSSNMLQDSSGNWEYNKSKTPIDDILSACGIQKVLPQDRLLQAIKFKNEEKPNLSTTEALNVYVNQGWKINLFSKYYDSSNINELASLEDTINEQAQSAVGKYVSPYSINFVYRERGGLTSTISWLLITILILILAFEIGGHVFYYIITGKFKPYKVAKKKKKRVARRTKSTQ